MASENLRSGNWVSGGTSGQTIGHGARGGRSTACLFAKLSSELFDVQGCLSHLSFRTRGQTFRCGGS